METKSYGTRLPKELIASLILYFDSQGLHVVTYSELIRVALEDFVHLLEAHDVIPRISSESEAAQIIGSSVAAMRHDQRTKRLIEPKKMGTNPFPKRRRPSEVKERVAEIDESDIQRAMEELANSLDEDDS